MVRLYPDEPAPLKCSFCSDVSDASYNLTSSSAFLINGDAGCGHAYCGRCVDRELSRRNKFSCPAALATPASNAGGGDGEEQPAPSGRCCGATVKRVTLSSRTLDDVTCERDASVRRDVSRVYNKTLEDFAGSLGEYNDFLEKVEDVIFDLVNGTPEEVKRRMLNLPLVF